MTARSIRVRLFRLRGSDLHMALSPDLRGLVVHGHSAEEALGRVESAARDILAADGIEVERVEIDRRQR